MRGERLAQAIRAQLQQAIGVGGEASASAYGQAAEEVPQDSERSIFENGAVNALYRSAACIFLDGTPAPHAVQFCGKSHVSFMNVQNLQFSPSQPTSHFRSLMACSLTPKDLLLSVVRLRLIAQLDASRPQPIKAATHSETSEQAGFRPVAASPTPDGGSVPIIPVTGLRAYFQIFDSHGQG